MGDTRGHRRGHGDIMKGHLGTQGQPGGTPRGQGDIVGDTGDTHGDTQGHRRGPGDIMKGHPGTQGHRWGQRDTHGGHRGDTQEHPRGHQGHPGDRGTPTGTPGHRG